MNTANYNEYSKAGYHQFRSEDDEAYGSFEVYWDVDGWYWVAGFPGCMPDGDPSGPFTTSQEAYTDALGG